MVVTNQQTCILQSWNREFRFGNLFKGTFVNLERKRYYKLTRYPLVRPEKEMENINQQCNILYFIVNIIIFNNLLNQVTLTSAK